MSSNELVVSNEPPPPFVLREQEPTEREYIPVPLPSDYNASTDSVCGYGCGQTGIPILPVVFSKSNYKVEDSDKRYFSHDRLTSAPLIHDAVASLPTHSYLYCYVQDKDYYIEEYYTGSDGALKRLGQWNRESFEEKPYQQGSINVQNINETHIENLENMAQPALCSKKNHSTLDSKYITLNENGVVWLMISHAKISESTLKKYFFNEKLRDKRMHKFVANKLESNKNTTSMSDSEVNYIESVSQRKQLLHDGSIDEKIKVHEKNEKLEITNSKSAASKLYKNMQKSIDGAKKHKIRSGGKKAKPMMMALRDPVGDVIAAVEKRNYLISKLDALSQDSDYIRKMTNALIIRNLEKSTIKAMQFEDKKFFNWGDGDLLGTALNKMFSDVDREKLIFKHINKNSYYSYLESSKEIAELKKRVGSARKEFIKAITDDDFKFIIENDFDISVFHDHQTARDFEAMIAACIDGCGVDDSNLGIPKSIFDAFDTNAPKSDATTEDELEKVLLPQLNDSVEFNQNWLLKAFSGLDQGLMYILYDFHKKERASEAVGSGIGYVSDRYDKLKLDRIKTDSSRSAIKNKAAMVNTMSHNLLRLSHNYPKEFRSITMTIKASFYGHTKVLLVPEKLSASMDTMVTFANFAMKNTIDNDTRNTINNRARKLKAKGIGLYERVSKTKVINAPKINTSIEAREFTIFHLERARETGTNADLLEPLYDGQKINLDTLDATALEAKAVAWHNKKLEFGAGSVSAFIAFFQLKAVIDGMPVLAQLKYGGSRLALTEAQLGMASTSLALVTASMDVTASGASALGKTSFAGKLLYGAGWIGLVGGILEIGSLVIYGRRKFNDGNTASWVLTAGAGASIFASSLAGFAYGIGAANASTGGLAAIPSAALIGIMMVGFALSYAFQRLAYKYDDKKNLLIEYWLDSSVFGNKRLQSAEYDGLNPFVNRAFKNLEQDISGFITACSKFSAQSELDKGKMDPAASLGFKIYQVMDRIRFSSQISMGDITDLSAVKLYVELVTKEGRVLKNIFTLNIHARAGDHSFVGVGSDYDSKKVEIDIISDEETQAATITVHDIYIKKGIDTVNSIKQGKVVVEYTPDTSQRTIYPIYHTAYMNNHAY